MQMTAAQGKAADMKRFLGPWTKLLKKASQGGSDIAAFLNRAGKGF